MPEIPRFNTTQYSCLTPDLSGPMEYLKRRKAKERLAQIEQRLAAIKSSGPMGKELLESIEQAIVKEVRSRPVGNARMRIAKVWIERWREACAKEEQYNARIAEDDKYAALRMLKDVYLAFDIKAFREDFQSIYKRELDGTKLLKERDELEKEKNEIINTVDLDPETLIRHFKYIPRVFSGVTSRYKTNGQMCEFILQRFADDWRRRAPMFREPVTIYGVAIRTLPDRLRKIWSEAYEAYELSNIRKTIQYEALLSDITEKTEQNLDIPKFFQKNQGKSVRA